MSGGVGVKRVGVRGGGGLEWGRRGSSWVGRLGSEKMELGSQGFKSGVGVEMVRGVGGWGQSGWSWGGRSLGRVGIREVGGCGVGVRDWVRELGGVGSGEVGGLGVGGVGVRVVGIRGVGVGRTWG